MSIQITPKHQQASGTFAGGLIKENKPIGFPQDGGNQKPYSNLFYWANAWSEKGGLIPEHPHKMFEILSFVLKGEIEHYDSKNKSWFTLKEGDVQIIRAGNGITHSERLMENSRIFQIWFDPNIQKTINCSASYNDYKAEETKIIEQEGVIKRNYIGNGGPITMESEGIEINELTFNLGIQSLNLDINKIYSFYVLVGTANIDDSTIEEHDFIKVEDESQIKINVLEELKLFEIVTPRQVSYKTYSELVRFK